MRILLGNSNDVLHLTAEEVLGKLREINNSGLNENLYLCDKIRDTKNRA